AVGEEAGTARELAAGQRGAGDPAAARCAAGRVRRPADADPLAAQGAVRGRQLPQAHQGDGRRGALDRGAGSSAPTATTPRASRRGATVPAEPFRFDWLAAKAADTSLPLG